MKIPEASTGYAGGLITNYRGSWSSLGSYQPGDLVTSAGRFYVATAASSGSASVIGAGSKDTSGTASGTIAIPAAAQAGDVALLLGGGNNGGCWPVLSPNDSNAVKQPAGMSVTTLTSSNISAGTLSYQFYGGTPTNSEITLVILRGVTTSGAVYASNAGSNSTPTLAATGAGLLVTGVTANAASAYTMAVSGETTITTAQSALVASAYTSNAVTYEAISGSGTTTSRTVSGGSAAAQTIITGFLALPSTIPSAYFTPLSDLLGAGPLYTPYASKSGAYTLTATDGLVVFTATATATLPTAVGCAGRQYTIKAASGAQVTVSTTSSQTIDANSSLIVGSTISGGSSLQVSVTVESDGANWRVVANGQSSPPTPYQNSSGAVTVSAADATQSPTILMFSTGGTVTLPVGTSLPYLGGRVTVVNCGPAYGSATALTLAAGGSNTIQGAASIQVPAGGAVTVTNRSSTDWAIVSSSLSLSMTVAKSAAYTISVADLLCWNTVLASGTNTITLPSAVNYAGLKVTIKNAGTGTITLATTSSQTIDGAAPGTLTANQAVTLQSDGANWWIVAKV